METQQMAVQTDREYQADRWASQERQCKPCKTASSPTSRKHNLPFNLGNEKQKRLLGRSAGKMLAVGRRSSAGQVNSEGSTGNAVQELCIS